MTNAIQIGRALLRDQFYSFACYAFEQIHPTTPLSNQPYLEAFCFQLEECARRRSRRLVVNMPPRQLKSFALVCLQAWMMGREPQLSIVTVAYGDELSRTQIDLFRRIVRSPWYQDLFPTMRIADGGNRLEEIRTTRGGARRAASIGGALTGLGGDVIFCDDLMKGQDANSFALRDAVDRFVHEVLLTRFNNPSEGVLIAALQRLHCDDVSATLLQLEGVRNLVLPAIAMEPASYELYRGRRWTRPEGDVLDPQRAPLSVLDEMRQRRPIVFAAQYQQAPESDSTRMLDINRMRFVSATPAPEEMLVRIQCWDTAQEVTTRADWSVGTCWGFHDGVWYLLDLVRGKWGFPELKAMVLAFGERWNAHRIYVEYASSGRQLVQQLEHEGHANVLGWEVDDPKEIRFFVQTGFLTSQRIAVLNTEHWLQHFRSELGGFPHTEHDDIVDSVSLFASIANGDAGAHLIALAENGWRWSRPRRGARVSRPRPSLY